MKRVSMPSGQAGMQLPLPLHTDAQRAASGVPLPPVIRSMMPAVVSSGSAAAETGRRDHRAGPEARAATRARLGNRLAARPEIFQIPGGPATAHAVTPPLVEPHAISFNKPKQSGAGDNLARTRGPCHSVGADMKWGDRECVFS